MEHCILIINIRIFSVSEIITTKPFYLFNPYPANVENMVSS